MRNSVATVAVLFVLMAGAADRLRGQEVAPGTVAEIRNQEEARPLFMPVFRLQNAKAADMQQVVGTIAAWLAEKPGGAPSQVKTMVVADVRTNSLIILTRNREDLERLAEIIRRLDAVVTEENPALPAKPAQPGE